MFSSSIMGVTSVTLLKCLNIAGLTLYGFTLRALIDNSNEICVLGCLLESGK